MTIRDGVNNSYRGSSASGIGANSLALTDTVFIQKNDGVVSAAGVGDTIDGTNYTVETFASDNQSEGMARAEYNDDLEHKYIVTISGGSVTVANEEDYFNITAAGNVVDGTTASDTTGQLQLVRFISATLGEFKIVNL